MPVTPEDLVEAWHLVTADEAEVICWKMPETLWTAVCKARDANECLDAGDELPCEGERCLRGSPVEFGPDDHAPILYIRKDGVEEPVAIIGSASEAS